MGNKIKNNENFIPIRTIFPGESIKESMEALNMNQVELAARLGLTSKHLGNILKGNSPITYETALKLEFVLGPSAEFWMNLENNYQLKKARMEKEEELSMELSILCEIPYNDLSKLGWVEKTNDKKQRIKNAKKFYRVADLSEIKTSYAVTFKLNEAKNNISDYGILAWLARAEAKGKKVDVLPFDKDKLKKRIQDFRLLTLDPPEIFYPKIKKICADCGVALVLVENLPKTDIYGATIWRGEKAIIALSVRGRKADIFWFTFFHELVYLIKKKRKEFHINYDNNEESEADALARSYLIEDKLYKDFIDNYNYKNPLQITHYAKNISIAPCILVERLINDKLIDDSYEYENLRPSF